MGRIGYRLLLWMLREWSMVGGGPFLYLYSKVFWIVLLPFSLHFTQYDHVMPHAFLRYSKPLLFTLRTLILHFVFLLVQYSPLEHSNS